MRIPSRRLIWAVAFLIASLVYLLSPIDLIPDAIPGLGQLDDITLLILALWTLHREWKSPPDAEPPPPEKPPEDPYSVLGLEPGASAEEVRKAYREQMALYHPDKVAHLGPDLQRTAHEKSLAIQEAYRKLIS